jgi:type VI secretion system protein ImpG
MDPRLLQYYSGELLYLRELAGEFARQHPKIARRLGMQAGEIGDPYVERLIQSAAMTFARMQMRIDEEFPSIRTTSRQRRRWPLPACFPATAAATLATVF